MQTASQAPSQAPQAAGQAPPAVTTEPGRAHAGARRARRLLHEHRPFLLALGIGAVLRVEVHAGFRPALVFSDGPMYLSVLDSLDVLPARPAGYAFLLLRPLSALDQPLVAIAAAQHLLGLGIGVLVYVLLLRWGVGRGVATLASLPALLDGLLLLLEHSVLTDTLFMFLVMLALVVLAWRRSPSVPLALTAGVLLGTAVTVRLVGQPLVVPAVLFCVLAADGWRRRLSAALAVVSGFVAVVGGYAVWYHSERGVYALSEIHGKALYVRTAAFVDCSRLSVPAYQRVLCPTEPLGQRRDPTYYAWRDARTVPRLNPPPGVTKDEAMHAFALSAIREQPADYARVAVRDFLLNFDPVRTDRFEHATAYKWRFARYLDLPRRDFLTTVYSRYGGQQLSAHQPEANDMVAYQKFAYVPGPVLLGCLLLGMLGLLGTGRAVDSGRRAVCFLVTATGVGLLLVPAATVEFIWRYAAPGLVLLPAAGALGYAALRGRPLADDVPPAEAG